MDPAVDRGDYQRNLELYWFGLPQWSPSSDGRSTAPFAAMITYTSSPEWSPPLNGRSTLEGVTLTFALTTQPQWSPPLNGRSA